VWGLNLPNANATATERLVIALAFPHRLHRPIYSASKMEPGILAANSSLYNKEAWRKVGGFDEAYGAGGEDSMLAAAVMRAGYHVIVDPAMSVHHTHGTGFVDSFKQLMYWQSLGKPRVFSRTRLADFRKELR
jgi:GT2 family glycosyltransferase